jgi:hypothetical protein
MKPVPAIESQIDFRENGMRDIPALPTHVVTRNETNVVSRGLALKVDWTSWVRNRFVVATGCFQRDYPLATASGSVPDR